MFQKEKVKHIKMIATFIITLVETGVTVLLHNLLPIQEGKSQDSGNYNCHCISFSDIQF